MSILLTDRELEQLAEIEQQKAISDEVMRLEPYDFFLRNGLVSHDFSSRLPVPPPVEGFISLPRNALVITDAGRQVLREPEQHRQKVAEDHAAERRDQNASLRNAIIGAVVGSLLTLILEHFREVSDGLLLLVQTLLKKL